MEIRFNLGTCHSFLCDLSTLTNDSIMLRLSSETRLRKKSSLCILNPLDLYRPLKYTQDLEW